ncbi:MAG TPA: AAA family ATPase, partial [Limnochordales bacterium]
MLVELHIRDFALIDRLHIEFAPGFNVLTGETGAGKSIVIDALQTVIGGRARADLVRTGRDSAVIEAVFRIPPGSPVVAQLEEMGVADPDDPEVLVLRREVLSTGRSRCWINGHPVTVGQLAQVGADLVDIHGQHEHQSLLVPQKQLELLDAYGGPAVLAL